MKLLSGARAHRAYTQFYIIWDVGYMMKLGGCASNVHLKSSTRRSAELNMFGDIYGQVVENIKL